MMSVRNRLLAASLLTIGVAGASDAAIIVGTYSGTANGTDTYGFFGTPGATFSGTAFTAVYTYDSGTTAPSVYGDGTYQQDNLSGPGTAALTIGGNTITISSNIQQIRYTQGSFEQAQFGAGNFVGANYAQLGTTVQDSSGHLYNSTDPTTPFSETGAQSYGELDEYSPDFKTRSTIYLYTSSASVTSNATVPEPASWLMMITGFGMLGMMLRSNRRVAVSFS